MPCSFKSTASHIGSNPQAPQTESISEHPASNVPKSAQLRRDAALADAQDELPAPPLPTPRQSYDNDLELKTMGYRPAYAQQSVDRDVLERLEKLSKALIQQQATTSAAAPQTPSPPPAAPLPAAQAPSAPPQPAELPAPRDVPAKSRNQITRVGADGDDQLSIHIQDSDIREVLELLSEQGGLNILASNSVQGKVSAALSRVDIDTALAAILRSTGYVARREGKFIYVGTTADFQSMEKALDRIGTRIYRPNYVKAAELQALITPMLTPGGVSAISVTSASTIGIETDSNSGGGDRFAGGEAVLVRDYEAVLAQVDQVFEELDRRPLQVAIEAMILSVKLNDDNAFGVDFQFLRDHKHVRMATGSPFGDVGEVTFKDDGLKFGFLDSSLGAFVNALETVGDTDVIATPRLMCLNKHKAEILIGAELGYLSTTITETSSTQNVEFLKVGTQLRLRPFISNDGLIRMEVHPELSTGQVRVEQGVTLPDKEVTQVTTNIMVPDGCTVIIGGLMREDLTTTTSQVPLLGSAPAIGWLFRSKQDKIERRELIVLITPHIVCDPQMCAEGDKGACEFHRRQAVRADHMCPVGTRQLGRKYFRLAQKAWADGDGKRAMQLITLSIHFDPSSRAAIDLRTDITAGQHNGDHSRPPGRLPAGPHPLPEQAAVPWMMDPHAQPDFAPGGVDPGRTGVKRNIEKPELFE